MPFSEGNPPKLSLERNDPVQNVVADVRAAAKSDAGAGAPFLHDRHFIASKIGVVEGDIADSSQPKSREHLRTFGLAVTWNIVRSMR